MAVSELVLVLAVLATGILLLLVGYWQGRTRGMTSRDRYWEDEEVPRIKEKSLRGQRATLGGLFSEQLAPYLPDFPFRPTEARFIGKPVDFLVFKGLDEDKVSEIVFVEVKSGKAGLTPRERRLRDAVKQGNVSWALYRVPEEITGSPRVSHPKLEGPDRLTMFKNPPPKGTPEGSEILVALEEALEELDGHPSSTDNFIGFVNAEEETIQFVRLDRKTWQIDVPVLEGGNYAYSLQDMINADQLKEVMTRFFRGLEWRSVCNLKRLD